MEKVQAKSGSSVIHHKIVDSDIFQKHEDVSEFEEMLERAKADVAKQEESNQTNSKK